MYLEAVVLLDQMAQDAVVAHLRFRELGLMERDALLVRHFGRRGRIHALRARLDIVTDAGRVKGRVWTFIIKELIAGFYSSAAGWAAVGYSHFPGNPGDPREYAAPPSAVQHKLSVS